MKTSFAFIAAVSWVCLPSLAEPVAPPYEFDGPAPMSTLRAPPPVDLHLGELHVKFGRTTLRDIHRAVGKGQIAHRGDAGDSTYWLCYFGVANSKATSIWLIAGEIDGPEHTVGVVQLKEAIYGSSQDDDCPALPAKFQRVSLGRAGVLGFTAPAAVARLGKPSSQDTDTLTYFYLGKKLGQYEGKTVEFDRADLLELRIVAGKVVGMVASQSITY